jgi:hypothetical protein
VDLATASVRPHNLEPFVDALGSHLGLSSWLSGV